MFVWKVTGLVSQIIYFNSKQQTTLFTLQSNPSLESNGLFHSLKRVFLIIPLTLGKRKNHSGQDRVNRKFVLARRYSSRSGTSGCSRCGEAAMIYPAKISVSSRAMREIYTTESPCRLTEWSSDSAAITHCWRCLLHQRTWSAWLTFDFDCLTKISDLFVAKCSSLVPQNS